MLKSQFLSQQYTTYDQYQAQQIDADSKLKMYVDSLAEFTVRAAVSGAVHCNAALTAGTVIQAGSLLGSVSAKDASGLYFEAVISAADRSKLAVGDGAEIALAGVMQSEFGVLTGITIPS
jgi:hypothetical protein